MASGDLVLEKRTTPAGNVYYTKVRKQRRTAEDKGVDAPDAAASSSGKRARGK